VAYLWLTTDEIQHWLNNEKSTIQIGDTEDDTYPVVEAERAESAAIDEIKGFLEPGWTDLPADDSRLKMLAARLTAAYIGVDVFAPSLGGSTSEWTERLKNEVFAHMSRMLANHPNVTITDATKQTLSLRDRLIAAKTRERAVVGNV